MKLELTKEELLIQKLILNSENREVVQKEEPIKKNNHFKIKDIVFLAIMSAVMLVSGAIMPLITQVPLFGIIQLCLSLQFSLFVTIGLMKVGKFGSLIMMSLFSGIVLAFMFLPMFFCLLICAFISELIAYLVFRSYKNKKACILSATIYLPLSLPFLYIYYNFMYSFTGEEGEAVSAYLGSDLMTVILISLAVILISFLGGIIGAKLTKELKKSECD